MVTLARQWGVGRRVDRYWGEANLIGRRGEDGNSREENDGEDKFGKGVSGQGSGRIRRMFGRKEGIVDDLGNSGGCVEESSRVQERNFPSVGTNSTGQWRRGGLEVGRKFKWGEGGRREIQSAWT